MADLYVFKSQFEPIGLVGETFHLVKNDEELDVEILAVGAMPHYVKDFGAVTSGTWLRSQQDTNLEMPQNEMAQWRMRVIDDIELYLKNPPTVDQWRASNTQFFLPMFPSSRGEDWIKEYYFKASEFFTFKTDIPAFDIYPNQTLVKSRVIFSGYRFRIKKISNRGKGTLFINGWGR